MSKKNTPEKTRQRTLAFVAVFVGFLGTSIFAGINVFAAHQKNQDFSQLDAEEKFSRLPEYLLVDRKLLRDKDFFVRSSAARALGNLQSKEAIPDLMILQSGFMRHPVDCSVIGALGKLEVKEAIPMLIFSSIERISHLDDEKLYCIVRGLEKLKAIPQLMKSFEESNLTTNIKTIIITKASDYLPAKELIHLMELYEDSDSVVWHSAAKKWDELQKDKTISPEMNMLHLDLTAKQALYDLNPTEPEPKTEIVSLFTVPFLNSDDIVYPNIAKTPNDLQLKSLIYQFVELLKHSNSSVRYRAAHMLSRLQAKETIPELITAFDKSNGIERYKILEALIILDGLNESQTREWMVEVVKELEKDEGFSDGEKKSLAIEILMRIYLRSNQKFKESIVKLPDITQSRQIRDNQWIFTVSTLAVSLFLFLLTLFCLRQLQRIAWKDHLVCYFPEEVVGELIALRHELTKEKQSILLVETTLLYVVFTLFWAFYVQINIDNLWLPSKDQHRR
jgi:HEAT repeat protein